MINFTKENEERLKELSLRMLFDNDVIKDKLGTALTINQLLFSATLNILREMKANLTKQIEQLDNDEWQNDASTNYSVRFDNLTYKKELVNLIIGWRLKKAELAENKRTIDNLQNQLKQLEESRKTPEEKIEDIKQRIEELSK